MIQRQGVAEDELARRTEALRLITLWFMAAIVIGVAVVVITWLVQPQIKAVPIIIMALVLLLTTGLAYWLNRRGKVVTASHFFVTLVIIEFAILTAMLGGFTGPMMTTYLFPIMVAGLVIGIRAGFLAAALSMVFYLATIPIVRLGWLPQLLSPGDSFSTVLTITITTLIFYLVAFLSWFAASRLERALQNARRYAAGLQTANEKLQASEEELRAANEELRATEEELRASNEELTAANEELKEAQEQLVRSERLAAIGQLAGGVGHELRNPLGAIKNAVYYIRGKLVKSELARQEPRVIEFLNIVDDEITSSNKIINDLLGFSRVGKPAVSPTRIEQVVDSALGRTVIPENIEVVKELAAGLPEVAIDPEQIQQVLVNVMTNAVQAMDEGGKLAISAHQNGKALELDITDTGRGIPPEVIGKIFDPLFTTRAKGIGLGLAVCKTIIERHQGSITVHSRPGEGTTFNIKLPL